MKSLILADLHGKNPLKLISEKRKEGIERIVCLGDYDTPQILEQVRELDIPKILVVGNHDFHHVYYYPLESSTLKMPVEDYEDLWDDYPEQKDFILDAIKNNTKNSGLVVAERAGGRSLAYAHASLLEHETCNPLVPGYVWGRMFDDFQVEENMVAMMDREHDVLFRGHDHIARVSSRSKDFCKDVKITHRDGSGKLKEDQYHVVSVGAFLYGKYAIFDDKTFEVQYFEDGD